MLIGGCPAYHWQTRPTGRTGGPIHSSNWPYQDLPLSPQESRICPRIPWNICQSPWQTRAIQSLDDISDLPYGLHRPFPPRIAVETLGARLTVATCGVVLAVTNSVVPVADAFVFVGVAVALAGRATCFWEKARVRSSCGLARRSVNHEGFCRA